MAFAKPNLVQPDVVPLAMTPVQRVPPERCKKHPLWELQERVAKEIANGDFDEPENGTWDGRWPTPGHPKGALQNREPEESNCFEEHERWRRRNGLRFGILIELSVSGSGFSRLMV